MRASRPRVEPLETRLALSTYYVATTGSDKDPGTLALPFKTIQHGLDMAVNPGDTVEVRAGTYAERLTFPNSGSAPGGLITLENFPGEHVLLTGKGAANKDVTYRGQTLGNDMVLILNQSYVKLSGLEIAYDNGTAVQDDAFAVRVEGSGSNVVIQGNTIHDITGQVLVHTSTDNVGYAGAGIYVEGSTLGTPYDGVILDGNTVANCQPGDNEAETVAVNGNVTNFQITNNLIHDDNNIGIDMYGGGADIFGLPHGTQGLPVARDGVCSHNTVYHIHANYGGGYAGGIYVDAGRDITVTDNVSYQNDYGLEVGAENHGYVASGIVVEDNLFYDNRQGGLVFGGLAPSAGRVENCSFLNNTVYNSDTKDATSPPDGVLFINWASNNLVSNNIFVASANNVLLGSYGAAGSNVNNTLDHNLYFAPGGPARARFYWNNKTYRGFAAYLAATGEDAHSPFGDPLFADAGHADFQLTPASPAINAGSSNSGWYAPTDFDGTTRDLPPDIGAYESEAGGLGPVRPPVLEWPGAGPASTDGPAEVTNTIDPQAPDELLMTLAGRHRKPAFP
jgi:hypothetical protein